MVNALGIGMKFRNVAIVVAIVSASSIAAYYKYTSSNKYTLLKMCQDEVAKLYKTQSTFKLIDYQNQIERTATDEDLKETPRSDFNLTEFDERIKDAVGDMAKLQSLAVEAKKYLRKLPREYTFHSVTINFDISNLSGTPIREHATCRTLTLTNESIKYPDQIYIEMEE